MSITLPTQLIKSFSTSSGTSQATGSFTMPSSGLTLAVWGIRTSGTLSNPTLTDNVGGTWVPYTDGTHAANLVIQTSVDRIKVFRCSVYGSGTATLTLDCGANNHNQWTWHVLHYPDAANQNALQIVPATGTGLSLLATLAAMQASSGTAGFGGAEGGTLSVGSGFTGAAQGTGTSLSTIAECNTGNDTTVDASNGSNVRWGMIAAELAPAGGSQHGGYYYSTQQG